ncbi:MAG: hypothetical protein KC502_03630 [Myxococcales bacterium]|nr:hypothetical protein [Myxococcales bacterium]
MPVIPETMLATLGGAQRAAVCDADPARAAEAMLNVVEGIPPFSSRVAERSQWLAAARSSLSLLDVVPNGLDVRLLAEIARTAFAAHEITPALTATEQALAQAEELDDLALCCLLRARRLPWLCTGNLGTGNLDDARAERATLNAILLRLPFEQRSPALRADICVAEAAYHAQFHAWDEVRQALAGLGRAGLVRDERLHWYACTSQLTLAQVNLRTGQRAPAIRCLIEAARIAHELEAWAELANIQTVIAAYAVRTGSFETAISHGGSALAAMESATLAHAQMNPWLGLPIDIATESEFAGVIRSIAESVVQSLDLHDRHAFLVSVCALVALYLVADRAPEALDALNEAIEAAQDMGDASAEALLRSVSESLLRFMGMLS